MIAHIRQKDGKIQTVKEHCFETAQICSHSLKKCNLEKTGYFIGLIHDAGKCKLEFEEYIKRAVAGENVTRGSVNHTFCAVCWILENHHNKGSMKQLAAEILAWAVGSHHGEFDCYDTQKNCGFEHRLKYDREKIKYDESINNFYKECVPKYKLDKLAENAVSELTEVLNKIKANCGNSLYTNVKGKRSAMKFISGMLARIILSALIDADRRNTADFESKKKVKPIIADKDLWKKELDNVHIKLDKMAEGKNGKSNINIVRRAISDEAFNSALNCKNGVYRLTVPTGAGKTLTALRFALAVCCQHEKSRCFFAIPLLSVLDQNAQVIRNNLSNKKIINEHHSNILKWNMMEEELDRYELVAESWETPIMVTTMVQLLNTLFSGKTQCIRRMKSLCNSVIVIDEVQTVPRKMLYMFNLTINFLADFCDCTVLLCSATQPCFEEIAFPLHISENCNIVANNKQIAETFKRTEIIDKTKNPFDINGLSNFILETIKNVSSMLVICNTKKEAYMIYNLIKNRVYDNSMEILHLSTNMCMQHRKDTIDKINIYLAKSRKGGKKIICISTQLVEAGVDFSFESLIRVQAGLDNIAQSAGRCNRGNEYAHICNVYVVKLLDENLSGINEIKDSQQALDAFLMKYEAFPDKYNKTLLDDNAVHHFYSILYGRYINSSSMEYLLNGDETMFDMMSINSCYGDGKDYILCQSFKTAGSLFTVFDDNSEDIIVPYNDEAEEIITELCSAKSDFDIGYMKSILQRAKPYTISLYSYAAKKLFNQGMLHCDDKNNFMYLDKLAFDINIGIKSDNDLII